MKASLELNWKADHFAKPGAFPQLSEFHDTKVDRFEIRPFYWTRKRGGVIEHQNNLPLHNNLFIN